MRIYVDPNNFECHVTNPDGTYQAVETDFFDGKCDVYIEGYRYVPSGQTWTRSDGVEFQGEMISPRLDYDELTKMQTLYENALASSEPRIAALEAENAALKEENATQLAKINVLSEQMDFYEDCIAEMAEVVYA